MRIIDADTHISSMPGGIHMPAEKLIERMDKNGAAGALVWLHPGQKPDEYCDYDGQNRYVYEMAKKYPDRLIPVGWLNPKTGTVAQLNENLRRQREEYGFTAIKLNGAQNYFDLLDEEKSLPLIEAIVESGAMLAFHSGSDQNTHPSKVAAIAARFPQVKILLVHMGQTANDAAIRAAGDNKNITLIGSGLQDYRYVRKAVDTLGSRRVCFGSDSPFRDMKTILDTYKAVLHGLPKDAIQNVMGDNILRFFGRESPDTLKAAAKY